MPDKQPDTSQEEASLEYPYLEGVLNVFRENDFSAKEALGIIWDRKAGDTMPGPLAEKYAELEDAEKLRVNEAVDTLCEAYDAFFSARKATAELKAETALEGLSEDIGKIFNSHGTPHHKARKGINNFLRQKEMGEEAEATPQDIVPATDTPPATKPTPPSEDDLHPLEVDSKDMRTLGVAAGTVVGMAAGVEAAKQWRERVKTPESRKKAIAFATVAAVSAVTVAASIFLGRAGGSIER